MSAKSTTLPIVEDIESLTDETINAIRRIGFCYVALPEGAGENPMAALYL